jgi:hypothetical protein
MDDGERFNGGSHFAITRTGDFTCFLSFFLAFAFLRFSYISRWKLVISKRGLVFR